MCVVVLVTVLAAFQMYYVLSSPKATALATLILIGVWIPILGFIYSVFFGIGYTIEGDQLIIKTGPLGSSTVGISAIVAARRSYNPISSPANSLKRLKITYKGGEVLISPEREEEFIKSLLRVNKNIEVNLESR